MELSGIVIQYLHVRNYNIKKLHTMKNLILISTILLSTCATAQVAIGKESVTNASVSLEFGAYANNQGKGVIVPWVTSAAGVTSAEKGTIVFDTTDKIVKYRKDDGSWFNLSNNETTTVDGTANFDTTGVVNTSLQDTYNGKTLADKTEAKTSIGTPTSTPGILVLEDTNKAMVLPKVPSPHLNIINPEPGTMVYDTDAKLLAVYNGKVWSFWKP